MDLDNCYADLVQLHRFYTVYQVTATRFQGKTFKITGTLDKFILSWPEIETYWSNLKWWNYPIFTGRVQDFRTIYNVDSTSYSLVHRPNLLALSHQGIFLSLASWQICSNMTINKSCMVRIYPNMITYKHKYWL